jgi:hypothetical protein
MMLESTDNTRFRSVVSFVVNNKVDHNLTINIDEYMDSHVIIELVCKDHGQIALMSFINYDGMRNNIIEDVENLKNSTNIKVNRKKINHKLFQFD